MLFALSSLCSLNYFEAHLQNVNECMQCSSSLVGCSKYPPYTQTCLEECHKTIMQRDVENCYTPVSLLTKLPHSKVCSRLLLNFTLMCCTVQIVVEVLVKSPIVLPKLKTVEKTPCLIFKNSMLLSFKINSLKLRKNVPNKPCNKS